MHSKSPFHLMQFFSTVSAMVALFAVDAIFGSVAFSVGSSLIVLAVIILVGGQRHDNDLYAVGLTGLASVFAGTSVAVIADFDLPGGLVLVACAWTFTIFAGIAGLMYAKQKIFSRRHIFLSLVVQFAITMIILFSYTFTH